VGSKRSACHLSVAVLATYLTYQCEISDPRITGDPGPSVHWYSRSPIAPRSHSHSLTIGLSVLYRVYSGQAIHATTVSLASSSSSAWKPGNVHRQSKRHHRHRKEIQTMESSPNTSGVCPPHPAQNHCRPDPSLW